MNRIDITPEWYEEIEVPVSELDDGELSLYRFDRDGTPLLWWVSLSAPDGAINIGHFDTEAEALGIMVEYVKGLPSVMECEACGKYVPEHRIIPGGDRETPRGLMAVPDTCPWCHVGVATTSSNPQWVVTFDPYGTAVSRLYDDREEAIRAASHDDNAVIGTLA